MTAVKSLPVHLMRRRDWPLWSDLPDPNQGVPAFGALPTAPAMARSHVRQVLSLWGLAPFTDDAVLIADELVTNVVEAVQGDDGAPVYQDDGDRLPFMRLGLRSDRECVLIIVQDRAPGIPVQKEVAFDAESGRGLSLIVLLGGEWGWYPMQGSKIVWAFLPGDRQPVSLLPSTFLGNDDYLPASQRRRLRWGREDSPPHHTHPVQQRRGLPAHPGSVPGAE